MAKPAILISGLIIAVGLLSVGVLAYPSVHVLIGQAQTWTLASQSTNTSFSTRLSTISSTTTAFSTSYESSYCYTDVVCYNFACQIICNPATTHTYVLYYSTTSWQVSSTTSYLLISSTTTTSSSTSYHTNTVAPYAYFGLDNSSFAGIAVVVLVLCGAVGFYTTRISKKPTGQARLSQFAPKKGICIKCGTKLRANAQFCDKCGSPQT